MKKFNVILLIYIVSLCECVTDPATYYFDADEPKFKRLINNSFDF